MTTLRQILLNDGAVLLWMMSETGASTVDQSGNGNTGVITAGTGADGPGPNLALSFDGATQWVKCEPTVAASLPIGNAARTLEIWSYPTVSGIAAGIGYGKDDASGEHCTFFTGSATAAGSAFSDGVNVGNNMVWISPPAQNEWSHCALAYAGGTFGNASLYKNGVLDNAIGMTLNTTGPINRLRCALRSDNGRASQLFTGRLAVAAIYPTQLSQATIAAHYAAGLQVFAEEQTSAAIIRRLMGI